MDEIETQIMQIMSTRPEGMEASEVVRELYNRFGSEYPYKRIRRKLNSMCEWSILTKTSFKKEGAKGPERNLYTIVKEGS